MYHTKDELPKGMGECSPYHSRCRADDDNRAGDKCREQWWLDNKSASDRSKKCGAAAEKLSGDEVCMAGGMDLLAAELAGSVGTQRGAVADG